MEAAQETAKQAASIVLQQGGVWGALLILVSLVFAGVIIVLWIDGKRVVKAKDDMIAQAHKDHVADLKLSEDKLSRVTERIGDLKELISSLAERGRR